MTKSLMWLLDSLLYESSRRCDTDTHRDIVTVSRRIEHEGESFVTITLPRFCQEFERALDVGKVDSTCFLGFKKRGALPVFLRGLLSQVFDPVSGMLLAGASVEAILCVRQVCLAYKKVELPCSERRVRKAFDAYLRVEDDLADLPELIWTPEFQEFKLISGILWSSVLSEVDRQISDLRLVPRHGPGATAERISGNQKYNLLKWHRRLEPLFPFDVFGCSSPDPSTGHNDFDAVEFVEPEAEEPVRVITVPKTLKAPRIIAIEPVCMQYAQQALMSSIVPLVESMGASAGHVNFRDQEVNRDLALQGSVDGRLATMDLSEASDRVHKDVVNLMLDSAPLVRDAVDACRSRRARLPDGTTVTLGKFASMGSALCFPMEAMVFFTLCIQARLRARNITPTPRDIFLLSRDVYVYGDDIIVPADEVSAIAAHLELFKLKVNTNKTFTTGKFRESCGMDAYDGVAVKPAYVRCLQPCDRRDASEIVSFVSLANQLYASGWWETARRVRKVVEAILGPLPTVLATSPSLGWVSVLGHYSAHKWDSMTHSFKVKGWVVKTLELKDQVTGPAALLKCFLTRGELPTFERHLERSVRPGSVIIKRRWVPPY